MDARWRVVSQAQRSDLAGTRFVMVMDVTVEVLDTGDQFTVTLPMSAYSVEAVASLVQPQANQVLAVSRIGNPG